MISCQPHKTSPCKAFLFCGGCDFLDFSEEKYRDFKKEILAKSGFENAIWLWINNASRRRVIFQIDQKNNLGFFSKKTNSLVKIDDCFVAKKEISDFIFKLKNFLKTQEENFITQIATTLFDNGLDLIFFVKRAPNLSQIQKLTNFSKEENINISYNFKNSVTPILLLRKNQIFYPNFKIDLGSEVFLQATKEGLDGIIEICRNEILQQKKDLKIIDLYSGFGSYSFGICDLVAKITAIEGDEKMVNLIGKNVIKNNLTNKINAKVCDLFLNPIDKKELSKFDFAIINPPRNGASPQITQIANSNLKNLIYISCNPQSFKRDMEILIAKNFRLKNLFAIDQFYGSSHLEVVGIFEN